MIELSAALLTVVALGLLVPAIVLAAECVASLWPARPTPLSRGPRPRVVVVVPAHNEATRIGACVTALSPQLEGDDGLIVVADNCIDDTAARARDHGATVLERNDPDRPGKGYALLHALDVIGAAPPDVVIFIDADSRVTDGIVATLARAAVSTGRPVQAAYLPAVPVHAEALDRISALAFVAKNVTRPRGLARLGLPCLLTGTGMAFPWQVIHGAPIAPGKTAEDMRLAVDLSIAGYPPMFCPEARLSGPMDKWKDGTTLQRTRWEHGHLETIVDRGVPLLRTGLRQHRPELLALALELCVPPLSLWVSLWTIAVTFAFGLALIGAPSLPSLLLFAGGLLVGGAVLAAWQRDGAQLVPAHDLLAAGAYVIRKIAIYPAFLQRRESQWELTGSAPARACTAACAADPHVVSIGPCQVHAVSEANLVQQVVDRLEAGEGGWIVTLNLDHLWHCVRDPEYAALCARGTFAVADGMPLVWVSRLQGTPLPERVAGANLITSLSAAAAKHGRSIFLVGGMPGDAEAAAAVLRARHPELRVAGVRDGLNGASPAELADDLRKSESDIVYVSLGKITEERLIERLRERLPEVWFIGVGTSFAFLSGRVRRAPVLMQYSGLEWIFRWTQEPVRLTRRYLRCIPLAIQLIGSAAVKRAHR